MGNRDTRIGGLGVGYDQVGAQFNDLQKVVNNALLSQGGETSILIDLPTVDTSFTPLYEFEGDRVYVTLKYFIPGFTTELTVVVVDDTQVVDEDTYNSSRKKHVIQDVGDADRQAQTLERRFDKPLRPEREHHVILLKAFDANGGAHQNPEEDLVFADYPGNVLFTFTTPAIFNVPSSPNASLIVFNRLDPTTKEYDAEVGLRVHAPLTDGGAAQTWGASGASEVVAVLTRVSDSAVLKFASVLSGTDLTQVDAGSTPANRGYVDITCKGLAPGAAMQWARNIAWLSDIKKVSSGSAVAFNAAGFQVDPANLTSLSFTITSATDPYSAKHVKVTLNFTQPATVVALKHVTVERKLQAEADAAYVVVVQKFSLRDDSYHTAGAKTVVVHESMKAKPNLNYTLRATITAIGGTQVQFTQNFTTGTDPDVSNDTDRPATPSAPTCQPFTDGNVKVEAEVPASQTHTIRKYRFAMSTSNTAPDRDSPSVGTATVVALKKAHLFTMFQRSLEDVSSLTFYFRVQALNDIGWSEWSPATSVLGSDVGRPLTDVIGTAVPTLPIRLERTNTSGTTHSSTTFQLDASANATDDYYNEMHLHVTGGSPAAADRIRRITDYVGSTKICTLDVAFGVTPSGSVSYEIHAGLEVGEKSGTSTGVTTTVALGSSASSTNDFYNGMSIYLPASAAADQIRRISDYNGGTKVATLESAISVAVATNACYAISKGSFGYAAINPLSGIIAGTPFRVWYDSEQLLNIIEVIMPTGENAFSINAINIRGYKTSTGAERINFTKNVTVVPSYEIDAPGGYVPIFRIRLQNLYRESGSDGWSSYSYYVSGYQSGATPGTPYDPAAYVPVEVDIFDPTNYPSSRYDF